MNESRTSKDALMAEFPGDDSILMAIDRRRYHRINETAARIWKGLEAGQSDRDIAVALTSDFEVTSEVAESSVRRFVSDLVTRGLVRDRSPR